MESIKADLIERIRGLALSIEKDDVQNRALTNRQEDIDHNSAAKMLRNGLAVVSFASLEDFIKKRSSKAMTELNNCSVNFNELPVKLQNAATFEILSALSYQMSLLDKADRTNYIQNHAKNISSTLTTNYELSIHTFAHSQANINANVIKDILKSFNIEDPWFQMSSIASILGLTSSLPLDQIFKNAALRRHRAAHVAGVDIPPTDLKQFVKEAFAIAITFDALLSKAVQKISENNDDFLRNNGSLNANDVKVRTIKFVDNKWKEYKGNSTRAYRKSLEFDSLALAAKGRAQTNKELIVEFDESGLVRHWDCK